MKKAIVVLMVLAVSSMCFAEQWTDSEGSLLDTETKTSKGITVQTTRVITESPARIARIGAEQALRAIEAQEQEVRAMIQVKSLKMAEEALITEGKLSSVNGKVTITKE